MKLYITSKYLTLLRLKLTLLLVHPIANYDWGLLELDLSAEGH